MPAKAQTMDGRVSAAEEWIEGHELRCEDRYRGIQQSIDEMRGEMKSVQSTLRGVGKIGVGVLLSIVAWLAVQLWNGSQAAQAVDHARIAALEHTAPVTVVQQNPAPKP